MAIFFDLDYVADATRHPAVIYRRPIIEGFCLRATAATVDIIRTSPGTTGSPVINTGLAHPNDRVGDPTTVHFLIFRSWRPRTVDPPIGFPLIIRHGNDCTVLGCTYL